MEPIKRQNIRILKSKISYLHKETLGPTVFLVHGNSLCANTFKPIMSSLSGMNLIAVDLPGHGESSWVNIKHTNRAYSLPFYSDIIVEVARKLNCENAVFVGHSLGGHILLHSSSRLKKAKGLALFGTPPLSHSSNPFSGYTTHQAMSLYFKSLLNKNETNLLSKVGFSTKSCIFSKIVKSAILKTDPQARELIGKSVSKLSGFLDEVKILEKLNKPIALFHAENDVCVLLNYIKSLKVKNLWKKKVHLVKDAGHNMHIEKSIPIAKLLTEFVKDAQAFDHKQ